MARTTPSTAQARADHKVVLVATVTDMIEWVLNVSIFPKVSN